MTRLGRIRGWFFIVASLIATAPLLADGSLAGTLSGRVRDESGGVLPGATVELISADKGFQRSAVSDSSGGFNFAVLPPGRYTVKATLQGFDTFESEGNVVMAENITSVTVSLKLAKTAETVTVSGDVPLVDKTNVTDTTTTDSSLGQALAIPRGYQTLVEFAPGVNDADADGNTNSHGALDSSNIYLFDGIDTTDPTTGTFGANNNFDAIQEVVVSNSAISAEYGRAQGAVINVITKSGTNTFHGSARALVTNDDWNSQNKGSSQISGRSFARTKLDKNVYDYLFTLGGPVWKDNIWFFGAYERNPQFTPPAQTAESEFNPPPLTGQNYTQTRTFQAWQGKLSGQITPAHALMFSAQADPFTGIIRNYWNEFGLPAAETAALTAQDQANDCPWACLWQVRYTGVFGSMFSVEATYAQQRGGITVSNYQGTGSPTYSRRDQLFYDGGPFDGLVERPRDQANIAGNMYTQLFGHAHQIKVGVDYQSIKSESSFIYPGNQSFNVSGYDAATRSMILAPGDLWFQGTPPEPSVSTGKIYGIYALDRFDLTDRLAFNVGVRVDIQDGESDLRQAVISSTTVAPRLTASYDIFGNGKTLAYAAYGVYQDFLVQSIVDSIYSGVPQQTNFDLYVWDGAAWEFAQAIRAPGNDQPINTGLNPSSADEFNIGFQQQIGNTVAVGLRGIYRRWNNLVDDARVVDAEGTKFTTPRNFSRDQLHRQYKALELTAEKRFSQRWQILANYTLSQASGNTEAIFSSQLFDYANETCTVDPVTHEDSAGNEIVDAPAVTGNCAQIFAHNRNGLLSYDSTHLVKIFVAYTYPTRIVNLTAAPSFTFSSGLPYQQQQTISVNSDTDVYYYTKKGSDRFPQWYQLNFALQADFNIFGPLQIGVKGEVLNLTNQQTLTNGISLLPNAQYGYALSRGSFNPPRNYQFSAVLKF